jgi:hypothetical protein
MGVLQADARVPERRRRAKDHPVDEDDSRNPCRPEPAPQLERHPPGVGERDGDDPFSPGSTPWAIDIRGGDRVDAEAFKPLVQAAAVFNRARARDAHTLSPLGPG